MRVAGGRFCEDWHGRTERRVLTLVAEHVVLRALCDRLEAFADGLPGLPPAEERHLVARQLAALLPRHQVGERAVLEALLPPGRTSAMNRALLDRIHGHHEMDAVHAQDLGAALETAGPGHDAPALGYMLRCFFDGCRRAMAFEELTILGMARSRLSLSTVALLMACLRTGPGLN